MAHETSETKPTEEDWNREIARFRLYRDLEADTDVMRRAKELPGILRDEAATIYDIANALDRTGATNADVFKYRAGAISDRILRRGYDGDLFWDYVWDELRQHLLERVTSSPSALRQRANALHVPSDNYISPSTTTRSRQI